MNTTFLRPEAEALLPVLLQHAAVSLPRGLAGLAAELPEGAGPYERRRQMLPRPAPASEVLRLSAYRSAPADLRARVGEVCAPRVALLQVVLSVLLAGTGPGAVAYRRGSRDARVSPEAAWVAVADWLGDAVQVARAVLVAPHPHSFLRFAVQFAVTDSHGYQGWLDRVSRPESLLDLETLHHPVVCAPEEVLGDSGDLLPSFTDAHLQRFVAHFPLRGVPLQAEDAPTIQAAYLSGMTVAAGQHDSRQNGWGTLRLPRGTAQDIARRFNLRADQERTVRRAFTAALDALVAEMGSRFRSGP
jgi:hypothetical protein